MSAAPGGTRLERCIFNGSADCRFRLIVLIFPSVSAMEAVGMNGLKFTGLVSEFLNLVT